MLERRLAELTLTLLEVPGAAASYVGYKRVGKLVFISGQLSLKDGKPTLLGKLGEDVSVGDGYVSARQCALNVGAAKGGDRWRLEQGRADRPPGRVRQMHARIRRCQRSSMAELLLQVLGPAGTPARAAVGVSFLPANVAVEVEAIAEVRP